MPKTVSLSECSQIGCWKPDDAYENNVCPLCNRLLCTSEMAAMTHVRFKHKGLELAERIDLIKRILKNKRRD